MAVTVYRHYYTEEATGLQRHRDHLVDGAQLAKDMEQLGGYAVSTSTTQPNYRKDNHE